MARPRSMGDLSFVEPHNCAILCARLYRLLRAANTPNNLQLFGDPDGSAALVGWISGYLLFR